MFFIQQIGVVLIIILQLRIIDCIETKNLVAGNDTYIMIDTHSDLSYYGGDSNCDYRVQNPCNFPSNDLGTTSGFWSTCVNKAGPYRHCYVRIPMIYLFLEKGKLPIKVIVFAGVSGLDAEVQLQYKARPGSEYQVLDPVIRQSDKWSIVTYDLTQIWYLSFASELKVFGYPTFDPGRIVIDMLIFIFSDDPSTDPPSEGTTESNGSSTGSTESTVSNTSPTESTESPKDSTISTTETETSTISTIETDTSTISTIETDPSTISTTESYTSTISTTGNEHTTLNSSPTERISTTPRYCEIGAYCEKTDRFGELWTGCAGELVVQQCPKNVTGRASWYCDENGIFQGNSPDYKYCYSQWLTKIEEEVEEGYYGLPIPHAKAKDFIRSISERTGKSAYFGHEIERIVNVSTQIFTKVSDNGHSEFEWLADRTWSVFGFIMAIKDPWEELSAEERSETGTYFVSELERTTLELASRASVKTRPKYRRNFKDFDQFRIMSGVEPSGRSLLMFPEDSTSKDSQVILPADWANYFDEERIKFVGLEIRANESNYLFPGHFNNLNRDEGAGDTSKILNANILGFSFGSNLPTFATNLQNRINLQGFNFTGEGVQIMFRHAVDTSRTKTKNLRRRQHSGEIPKPVLKSAICAFWDTITLEWSADGCKLINSDQEFTLCECSHLTSFAVLMDVHNYVGKDAGLEILTLLLSSLSIICLISSIIVFTKINSKLGARARITKNLCISLLAAHSLFLLLADRHYLNLSEDVCTASAMILHYIFLTVFGWTGIQGYHLYRQMTQVFQSGSFHMGVYRSIALGLPIPLVGATALVAFFRDERGYGDEMFCWLNGDYVLWTFMVPIAIVCLGNTVVLGITLRAARQVHSSSSHKIQRRVRSYRTLTIGVLSITALLGLTWLTGFFIMVGSSSSIFAAYLFTLLNASQGVFLFVFHCLLNTEIRTALSKKLGLRGPFWSPTTSTKKTDTSKFRSDDS